MGLTNEEAQGIAEGLRAMGSGLKAAEAVKALAPLGGVRAPAAPAVIACLERWACLIAPNAVDFPSSIGLDRGDGHMTDDEEAVRFHATDGGRSGFMEPRAAGDGGAGAREGAGPGGVGPVAQR